MILMFNSKGVAPLIVIVVFLLVVAGSSYIIYAWVSGFISGKTSEATQASEFIDCSKVAFILKNCSYVPGYLKMEVESLGQQDLNGFTAQILYQNGTRATYISSNTLPAKSLNVLQFLTDHNLPPEKITIYPNACPTIRATTTTCSYSNVGGSTLSLQEGSVEDTNSILLDSNTITLSQTTSSKTFTNEDFSGGTFYFTEVASIDIQGELDYAGSLPSSLRMYLKMNSIGDNKVSDATDYNNHGYVQGSVSLASGLWTTNALNTDGSADNYLEAQDSSSLDLQDAVTISAWIKPDSATQGTILAKGNSYRLYVENGYIVGEVNGQIVKAPLPAQ